VFFFILSRYDDDGAIKNDEKEEATTNELCYRSYHTISISSSR
jgi:hypothetical protein